MYDVVKRLSDEWRARVRGHRWTIEERLGRPVLVNTHGDCPLACALGMRGAIRGMAAASAISGQEPSHPLFKEVVIEVDDFMVNADDLDGAEVGDDRTGWVLDAFGLAGRRERWSAG